MTIVKAPLLSLDARGTLANNLTFARVRGGTVAKAIPTHPDARTYAQFRQRLLFWAGIDHWHSLSSAEQAAYHTQGRPFHLTGYQYHQRQYLRTLPDIALWLHMDEQTGTESRDISPHASHGTIFGATPTPTPLDYGLDFVTDDYVLIPAAATQLNFTSGDFSIVVRLKLDTHATESQIFMRGNWKVDGYSFFLGISPHLVFRTNQAEAVQESTTAWASISPATWYTFGLTRAGASARFYMNGVDSTTKVGVHVDPLTAARSAVIGIHDNKVSRPFDGTIDLLAVFTRALSLEEHATWHTRLTSFSTLP